MKIQYSKTNKKDSRSNANQPLFGEKNQVSSIQPPYFSIQSHIIQKKDHELSRGDWKDKTSRAKKMYDDGRIDDSEKLFVQTLREHGMGEFNASKDGISNPNTLKEGLNFVVHFGYNHKKSDNIHANGTAGFVSPSTGFTSVFPVDIFSNEEIKCVLIIGGISIDANSRELTKATIEHEKIHFEHKQIILKHYNNWLKQLSEKEKQKIKKSIKSNSENSSKGEEKIMSLNYQIQANYFTQWIQQQGEKISPLEKSILIESTESGSHLNTEILASLNGFTSSFHLVPLDNLNKDMGIIFFDRMAHYAVGDGKYWKGASKATKDHFMEVLRDYYCNKLNKDYQIKFDEAALWYEEKNSKTEEDKDFFKRIKEFTFRLKETNQNIKVTSTLIVLTSKNKNIILPADTRLLIIEHVGLSGDTLVKVLNGPNTGTTGILQAVYLHKIIDEKK